MPRPPIPRPSRLVAAPLLRAQSDDRLVELVRGGHEPAFAVVVQRYRGQLERYAARIVGPGRAEDAVQQAFVNAHRALLRDGRQIELKAWLYRITHNAALNQLRSLQAEPTDTDDRSAAATGATAAAAADVAALRARLRETLDAVAALPAPQRDALLLRELEGRSHEEIALALGVSAGAARQHLARARTTLRAAVSAVTPYPLVAKLAALGTGSSAAGSAAELVVGAGMGATVIKFGAGVAAGGALLGAIGLPALRPVSPPPQERTGDRADSGAVTTRPGPLGAADRDATASRASDRSSPTGTPSAPGRGGRSPSSPGSDAAQRPGASGGPGAGSDSARPSDDDPDSETDDPTQGSRPEATPPGRPGSSGSSSSGLDDAGDDDDPPAISSDTGSDDDDDDARPAADGETESESSGSASSGPQEGASTSSGSGSGSWSDSSGTGSEAGPDDDDEALELRPDGGEAPEEPDEDDIAAD